MAVVLTFTLPLQSRGSGPATQRSRDDRRGLRVLPAVATDQRPQVWPLRETRFRHESPCTDAYVGPPLHRFAQRVYMIRDPSSVDPATAMPDLGVSDAHIAAYLAALE